MKILRGNLTETRFAFPEKEGEGPLELISEKVYKENAVAYMADELGLHRVSNKGSDFAVSLHCRNPSLVTDTCHATNPQLCSVHSPQRSQEGVPHL